jgi:hypothetical protein
VPRYYIQQGLTATVVRATATGAVTASVRCPEQHARVALEGIAAGAHQTFFVACATGSGQGASYVVTASRIYRFRITGAGHVSGWSLVRGGVLDGLWVNYLAASPDGSEVAVSISHAAVRSSAIGDVVIINTRTGTRAVWHNDAHERGAIGDVRSLSLTSGGRELVFVGSPGCVTVTVCLTIPAQVRALSPASEGGQLESSRVLLRGHPASWGYTEEVVVTPDGSALTVVRVNSPGRGPESVSVVQVSPVTGQTIRVLYRVITGNGFMYRFLSSDPSGRYLLLNAGPTTGTVNGWIDHGRLVPLTPADGDNVFDEAW